jgi:hypothetical protein
MHSLGRQNLAKLGFEWGYDKGDLQMRKVVGKD